MTGQERDTLHQVTSVVFCPLNQGCVIASIYISIQSTKTHRARALHQAVPSARDGGVSERCAWPCGAAG